MRIKNILLSMLKLFATLAWVVLIASVTISQFAGMYWWAELFTHFTPHYFIVATLLSAFFLMCAMWYRFLSSALLMIWFAFMMFPLWSYPLPIDSYSLDGPENIRVLQFNMRFTDQDVQTRMQWVTDQAQYVDVLVLLEVSDQHQPLLDRLSQNFPYKFIRSSMRGPRGVAMFSRLPKSEFTLLTLDNTDIHYVVMKAAEKVRLQQITLYAVHPPPPVSEENALYRNKLFDDCINSISQDKSTYKILVGDFNMTRWSPVFKNLAQKTGMRDSFEGFGWNATWPNVLYAPFRIAIDNLMTNNGLITLEKTVGPDLGSDHLPVITTLRIVYK